MTIYGYARCSTDQQDYSTQVEALIAAGAAKVFSEKISGAQADNRQELAKAMASLRPGDVLLITRLDRLARNVRDLLNILDAVSKAGAGFRCLDVPALDTSTPYGQLLLNVLGALAQFERSLILARTKEGRTRAKARGVRFGRKPKLTPYQRQEAIARREAGETLAAIARSFNVSTAMISRLGP